MQTTAGCCDKGCQLCKKQQEIAQLQHRHKRDLSLQSIYRKDYHHNSIETGMLALKHRTKNESSNIQGNPKSHFVLHSTYGLDYHPNNPQKPHIAHSKDNITSHKRDALLSYKSTYQSNYNQHPSYSVEENYKIADPQFYNVKTPFPQVTEYKQHYKLKPRIKFKQQKGEDKNQQKKGRISLFETTQRHSYASSRKIDLNLPAVPQNNMTTLPTSPSLFTTTYRKEFSKNKKQDKSCLNSFAHLYNF